MNGQRKHCRRGPSACAMCSGECATCSGQKTTHKLTAMSPRRKRAADSAYTAKLQRMARGGGRRNPPRFLGTAHSRHAIHARTAPVARTTQNYVQKLGGPWTHTTKPLCVTGQVCGVRGAARRNKAASVDDTNTSDASSDASGPSVQVQRSLTVTHQNSKTEKKRQKPPQAIRSGTGLF